MGVMSGTRVPLSRIQMGRRSNGATPGAAVIIACDDGDVLADAAGAGAVPAPASVALGFVLQPLDAAMPTAKAIIRSGCLMSLFVYPRSVGSWKLLVVDDDPDIRRIAALSLGRLGGFQVALASCAEEALAEVANNRPDLVLLDVTMPGTDGPTTLAAIHALPGSEDLPVVFFTATSSDVEVRACARWGPSPCCPSRSRSQTCRGAFGPSPPRPG